MIRVYLFFCLFCFISVNAWANTEVKFSELLKDIHQQIEKWDKKLEEMENDPSLPLVKKSVIKTLRNLLENINKLLKKWLPKEPKVKKTYFKQLIPKYVLLSPFLNPSLIG